MNLEQVNKKIKNINYKLLNSKELDLNKTEISYLLCELQELCYEQGKQITIKRLREVVDKMFSE